MMTGRQNVSIAEISNMKKENKDFTLFKKTFEHYQKLFGLGGYKVYFKYEPLEGCYASISTNQEDMVTTVSLDSSDKDKKFRNVKQSAKHEALHLLLHRIEDIGENRFARKGELYEACEEAVHKLENLIQ